MIAPTWIRKSEILSATITCDPLGAFLLRRTIIVINADAGLLTIDNEWLVIEMLDHRAGHLMF
jgi:hypothetical protein